MAYHVIGLISQPNAAIRRGGERWIILLGRLPIGSARRANQLRAGFAGEVHGRPPVPERADIHVEAAGLGFDVKARIPVVETNNQSNATVRMPGKVGQAVILLGAGGARPDLASGDRFRDGFDPPRAFRSDGILGADLPACGA